MDNKIKNIPLKRAQTKVVTPREYLSIDKNDIKRSRISPPVLGTRSFGKIVVEFKTPRFELSN